MGYKISYTKKFEKNYKQLSKNEQKVLKEKIKLLIENPMHPSLRTKKIQGTDNFMEFSLNMSIRVIWYYENDNIILMLDIGHHDILKKF